MRLLSFFIFIFLSFSFPIFSQSAGHEFPSQREGRIVVQFEKGADRQAILEKVKGRLPGLEGLRIEKTLSAIANIYLVDFEDYSDCSELTALLERTPGVRSATWDRSVQFRSATPDDPLFTSQWNLRRIGLPEVWDLTTGGQTAKGDDIVVAVLDSGFDLDHVEFEGNIWVNKGEIPDDGIDNDGNGLVDDQHGWNFTLNSPSFDVASHGTSVTGIIAAKGNNGEGMAGVNWDVKVMFLRIFRVSEIISALDYILTQRLLYNESGGAKGAFVVAVNGSFGLDMVFCSEEPAWGEMFDLLGEAGVLSVAATANENWDVDKVGDMPTTCPSEFLMTVTSTDSTDQKFANVAYGRESIDMGAPSGTVATSPGNQYRTNFQGASAACPHLTGSVALLYSLPCGDLMDFAQAEPAKAALLVRDALLLNVDPISSLMDKTTTGGRLNVFEASKYLYAWCVGSPEERESGDFKNKYLGGRHILRVFPNPVKDELKIDFSNDGFTEFKLRIFNLLGQELGSRSSDATRLFEPQQISLDVSDWPSGIYFLTLSSLRQKEVWKFVKI